MSTDVSLYCEHDHLADACEDCALDRYQAPRADPDTPADASRKNTKPPRRA